MTHPRKRGRPRLAAASLDDALRAVAFGTAPKRPRNEFERQAAIRHGIGRRPSPNSRIQIAVALAEWLIDGGTPRAAAVKRASAATGTDPANVRRYLRKRDARKYTTVAGLPVPWGPTVTRRIPLLFSIEDVGRE